jgi:Permease family
MSEAIQGEAFQSEAIQGEAMQTEPVRSKPVHPVDEILPLPKLFALGLQHVLVMYANAVAVPLIIGGALHLPKDQMAMLTRPISKKWNRCRASRSPICGRRRPRPRATKAMPTPRLGR